MEQNGIHECIPNFHYCLYFAVTFKNYTRHLRAILYTLCVLYGSNSCSCYLSENLGYTRRLIYLWIIDHWNQMFTRFAPALFRHYAGMAAVNAAAAPLVPRTEKNLLQQKNTRLNDHSGWNKHFSFFREIR